MTLSVPVTPPLELNNIDYHGGILSLPERIISKLMAQGPLLEGRRRWKHRDHIIHCGV